MVNQKLTCAHCEKEIVYIKLRSSKSRRMTEFKAYLNKEAQFIRQTCINQNTN